MFLLAIGSVIERDCDSSAIQSTAQQMEGDKNRFPHDGLVCDHLGALFRRFHYVRLLRSRGQSGLLQRIKCRRGQPARHPRLRQLPAQSYNLRLVAQRLPHKRQADPLPEIGANEMLSVVLQ